MGPTPCLQNKQGEEAHGLTAMEATDRMTAIISNARAAYRKHPDRFGFHLRFSWDSASAHTSSELDLPILPDQLLKPPAHSPDLQRCIEIPHAWIRKEFNQRLCADRRIKTVKAGIQLLKAVVKDAVTKYKVRKLVEGMPATYENIIDKKGDWADKRHR